MAYPDPEIQSNPEFYSPWPLLGKRLNFQWGNLRQDTAVSKAIIRAQVQDVETGDDFINADRILSGLEFGELTTNTTSFKNRFRLFYDKVLDQFCIQYNNNTESSPNWIDYLCIDQNTGVVTVTGLDVGELGIDVSGGFYGIKAYTHMQGSESVEWIVQHNLATDDLIVQTFNTRDRVIQFNEADTSNPNIAYFYFITPQAGKAVLLGDGFVSRTMRVSESDGTPTFSTSNIIFDSEFFYLTPDSTGDPVVSLRSGGEINTASNLGSGSGVFAQKAGVDLQFKSLVAGSNITLTPSATAITVASTGGGGGDIDIRESDGNPPTFSAADTLVFDSEFFYLHSTSTGKPTVSIRGSLGGGGATYVHTQTIPDFEWIVPHNLNSKNLIAQTFDAGDEVIEVDKVDTSDPNTAYFYLIPAAAGKAVITTGAGAGGVGSGGGGGGSALEVTDGTNSQLNVSSLNFNDSLFYISTDLAGEPVVNWDLKNGFQEVEIELDGDSKNINWDWSQANAFFVGLQKNTTLHEPLNYRGRRAQTVTLITKQPPVGFYNMSFGRNYIFPGGDSEEYTTLAANVIDAFSFHYSARLGKISVFVTNDLFY